LSWRRHAQALRRIGAWRLGGDTPAHFPFNTHMQTDRQTDSYCIVQLCDAHRFFELVTHSTYALYAPLRDKGHSGYPVPTTVSLIPSKRRICLEICRLKFTAKRYSKNTSVQTCTAIGCQITEDPVRSPVLKLQTGGLVLRWVTTWESPLLYVFFLKKIYVYYIYT